MKLKIPTTGTVVSLAGIGLLAWLLSNRSGTSPKAEPPRPSWQSEDRPMPQPEASRPRRNTRETQTPSAPARRENRLADALAKAAASEDAKALLGLLGQIRSSPDAALRQDAVEALVWLGSDYLPDLMAFVTDPDELVRETALDGCDIFIDAIEDERLRVRTIKAFTAHLSDPNALETTLAKLESVKESLALETLNDILKDGTTAAREAAKEEYERITGDEFTSFVQLQRKRLAAAKEETDGE